MIYFELNNLNKENIYRKTLSMIEYLCDKYSFTEQRGVIEMTNQCFIEQLQAQQDDFSVDITAHLENNTLVFNYLSEKPLFQFVEETSTDLAADNIWGVLVENLDLSADYKSLTIDFYVKPHQNVTRPVVNTILQKKDSYQI
ncbi:MAG: hypothetical protein J5741_01320 [Bacteroidales bacterium]|nr:hypothetical protein [Bacteroidales bacterium]